MFTYNIIFHTLTFYVQRNVTNFVIITFGSVSLKQNKKNKKSPSANKRANIAGTTNHSPVLFLAHTAKAAPINGPTINPSENAIPTRA